MDSFGDHRLAMLGAVAGLVSREGVRLEGAEAVAISFPDSSTFSSRSHKDDRRHRRARRGGKEHGRQPPRGAPPLPLPRHRRDVPRAHVARDAGEDRPLERRQAGRTRARAPRRPRRVGAGLDRRHGRHLGDPPVADRPHGPRRRAPSRGARGDARAPARARRARQRRHRGPRHRHGRLPERRREGLSRSRPRSSRAAAPRRAARHRRRRARHRPPRARRERPRAHAAGRGREVIDTSDLDVDDVVDRIEALVRSRLPA